MNTSTATSTPSQTPPTVHPRYLRGAGHAARFRLHSEADHDEYLRLTASQIVSRVLPLGATSFRVLRFEDGSYLHRMTFVSFAAWRRHAASVEELPLFHRLMSLVNHATAKTWVGMNTLIPVAFAPDLDDPRVPRPRNPMQLPRAAGGCDLSADTDALNHSLADDEDTAADDAGTESDFNMSVTMAGVGDGRGGQRAESLHNRASPGVAASVTTSITALPPSRVYTEGRASAGLVPDAHAARGFHATPVPGESASVHAGHDAATDDGCDGRVTPPSDPSAKFPPAMIESLPAFWGRVVRARVHEEDLPKPVGFAVLVDGFPDGESDHGGGLTGVTGGNVCAKQTIRMPAGAPSAIPRHAAPLPQAQAPNAMYLAELPAAGATPSSSEHSGDVSWRPAASTAADFSSASSGGAEERRGERGDQSTASVPGCSELGRSGSSGSVRCGHRLRQMCVLVAFADDKKKRRCRLDTAVCSEPVPGRLVYVAEPSSVAGEECRRVAKVLSTSAWSTRKGSRAQLRSLPAVCGFADG